MKTQYKVILTGKNVYKEVLLPEGSTKICVGTESNADVRMSRDSFFEKIEIAFWYEKNSWTVTCASNLYFFDGSLRKLPQKQLQHGDELEVRYYSTEAVAMAISFMIDFDQVDQDYSRVIDIREKEKILIGGTLGSDIRMTNAAMQNESMCLMRQGGQYVLEELKSTFGVYVNGVRINKKAVLNNHDFFSLDRYKFFLKGGWLYTTASEIAVSEKLTQFKEIQSKSSLSYPKFNLSTRVITCPNTEKITVLDPPDLPEPPQDNLVVTLAPALAMLAVTVLLRGVMSGSGASLVLFSVCTMGIGILTSIFTFFSGRKKYKQSVKNREEKYREYIEKKREIIRAARNEERADLENIYCNSESSKKKIIDFSGDLFDRKVEDEDYLEILVGEGARKSLREIEYKKQEKIEVGDELTFIPERIKEEYQNLEHAPITVPLKNCNAIGVVGTPETWIPFAQMVTLDLVVHHYYTNLKLYFVTDEKTVEKIKWVRWLPHVGNQEIQCRNIVCDAESRNLIFEYLFVKLSAEEETECGIHSVVFVVGDAKIQNHPLIDYIGNAGKKGIHFVFFAPNKEKLPQHCDWIIELNDNSSGVLVEAGNGNNRQEFSFKPLANGTMESLAYKLAPVYCDEVSLESSLTKNYSFFQMLNIFTTEDIDLDYKWKSANIEKSMAAPIGVNSKKELVFLDLHEKAHGPHGLVAGTTGSGKSEILQSYILSMAINYHPYEVGFVIIDFKGGGMANQIKGLPHLIGTITNIDGREIDRSLKSIKAELQKRQRLFAEQKVNKIDAYIRKFKKGEAKTALPHLIIIVDEFAELKADQPEFMKELISAARIGRSLGVHLILATQKPSGQVNEQIWSNSRFKLCLKVQSQEDSKEVLKSPLAAEIREAGRAYLQVGNNEIFELFQSAYSGGPAKNNDLNNEKEFSIYEMNLWGKKSEVFHQSRTKEKGEGKETSQLRSIIEYVSSFCEKEKIDKLPEICLPALKSMIPFRKTERNGLDICVNVGDYDDPDNQYQGPVTLNLSTNNTLIIGSTQSGKTTLLQTIIRGIQEVYTPQQANIYIADFNSKILKQYENSNFVGGVVCATEDEKFRNMLRLLNGILEERKNKLAVAGVSSHASYREAGYTDLPQIIVIIDDFTAMRELYLAEEDGFLPICRDGITMGISVIVTNKQTNGIGFKYINNFSSKIAMQCNDTAEYGALLDRCRMTPSNYPGRGLIELNKSIYEFQTYVPFIGTKEIDRVNEIQAHILEVNNRYPGQKAVKIPEVPMVLNYMYLEETKSTIRQDPYKLITGINYETVEWCYLDLCKVSSLTITGREKFGKTNYLSLILDYLYSQVFDCPSKAYIIDDYSKSLERYKSCGFVEKYTVNCADLDLILEEIEGTLKGRQERQRAGENIDREPALICVLQNNELVSEQGIKKATADTIRRIIKTYGRMKVCFIFASVENEAVAFNGPEGMKLAKESKVILFMDDLSNLKLIDLPVATVRKFKKRLELGDAYVITDKEVIKQKTVHAK